MLLYFLYSWYSFLLPHSYINFLYYLLLYIHLYIFFFISIHSSSLSLSLSLSLNIKRRVPFSHLLLLNPRWESLEFQCLDSPWRFVINFEGRPSIDSQNIYRYLSLSLSLTLIFIHIYVYAFIYSAVSPIIVWFFGWESEMMTRRLFLLVPFWRRWKERINKILKGYLKGAVGWE